MGLRLLALACLVGAALAGPLQRDSQCATRCPSSSHDKFNYEPGRKYVYDYKGVNHVVIAGQRKQKTLITAQVEIHVKTKCDLVLRMRDVALEHKAPWSETAELVKTLEIPLPFAYEDGRIEHVCPTAEETPLSLNLKRAVLSAFINTMDSLENPQEVKEVDSLGTCHTRYTLKSKGRQIVIEKEKDLKSCTNRHSSVTSLMANQYESPESSIHTIPIFPHEKLTCREVIEGKIIKSVECWELSTIKPLTDRDSIVELEGHMEMRLTRTGSLENMQIPPLRNQETVLFHLEESSRLEDKKEEVQTQLQEMCEKNSKTIDWRVSKDFIQLVASVKRLSYESLHEIYSSLESGSLCSSKKLTDMYLDTLPMAGTDATIKLMVQMILEEKVSGLKAKLWTASLSLVSNPSEEAIAAVVPLIQKQKSGSVLLGVSAMVYRHCSNNNCENSRPVREIVSALNAILGQQCSFDSDNEAISVLKAFGNMGQLLDAEQNILACAKDSDKNLRVRLAAIDAFRRVNKKKPEELLHLYADTQEHYEVRIAALSSVLRQADQHQLQLIKSVLEQESDEQVSTYAGTLLENYNRTSSPLKKHVKRMLNAMEVQAPKANSWTNSKNLELSTFSENLNIGGSVEADVIHSPQTKIPRSIYSRFDMDVFDKHINVFEMGVRAEGLEAAFKKLMGMYEPKSQRSSWNLLSSNSESEDDKIRASFFFRTMNTEIFDFSVDDLAGMGEMIKIAEILEKVSHDKSADFSHSFMFMNSKLIIPSVTGRSYSFGVTGSATVGLTASSKIDIVNIMSKNCDVHGHLKPSVNVEIAAEVGIHSEKPRPDVKIITRLHAESDIEAQFKIKDGHMGLFKISMPSENIALTRISSDIVEIDANHEETRVYENMQTKVDYCFNKLEKPLGVSICGKWEVPRPFMSKTFPFVKGVGNVELSIKKADSGLQGFELSFEAPKHKSHQMRYRAVLDTPGSRINRRFAANLEIRSPSRGLKEFSFALQSPFRSISASATGSLQMQPQLIEGHVDLQAGSSHRCSIKVLTPISETDNQKSYQPSIEVSSTSFQTLKVDGSVIITKGRKQEISFDLRSNKPTSKPLALKGTIVKDGKLSWSKNAEWKLSTDVTVKVPHLNLQVRTSSEKQSKLAQTIASSITVDYQKDQSRRQSMKLTTKVQKSSSKISSVAQFETTEYSSANFILSWNMQGKLSESLKNDISLRYGRNPEQQYISIRQSSKRHESQRGECKVSVKAPQLNIDSDISTTYDIRPNSQIHTNVDFRYKADKHIRSDFQFDKLSSRPLKMKIKAELQTPNRRITYQDELEEFASNSYKGNAMLEWREDKRAEFQYKYQNKNDRSKYHHDIEMSLRLPNLRSPIKHRASLQMSQEKVGIECRLSLNRQSEFSLVADLNKRSASYVSLKMPKVEGNVKIVNEEDKKAADMDLKLNLYSRPRHIITSITFDLKNQKKVEIEMALDADRKPDHKFRFSSEFRRTSRNTFMSSSQLQVLDKVKVEASASGDLAIYGKHEASIQAALSTYKPVEISIKNDFSSSQMESVLRFSKEQKPKVELRVGGEYSKDSREIQLSTHASIQSFDRSFQTKKWNTQHTFTQSKSSSTLKSSAKLELSPSKVYESEISYDFQPNMLLMKANLQTPHRNFERQLIGLSIRKSESLIQSSANLELSNGKSISIESESQIKAESLSSSVTIKSSFDMLKEASVRVALENQQSQKSLKMSCELNGEMMAASELSMQSSSRRTELKGSVKASKKPELSMRVLIEKNREDFKYDAHILKDSSNIMSVTLSKQVSGGDFSYALQSRNKEKTFFNVKISKDKSKGKCVCMIEAHGPIPHLSFTLESSPKDKKSLSLGVKACLKSEEHLCYFIKVYHKALLQEDNYIYYKKLAMDIEKSARNQSPVHVANINLVASIKENEFKEKFIIETNEKKFGYDFRLHRRENENDHCSLESHIFMAERVARIKGSVLHNARQVLLDFEVVPDAAVPSRKLGLEMKKEMRGSEVSGYLTMIYPGMSRPIELTGHIKKNGMIPVEGKVKLDSSAAGGKVLIFEIIPEPTSRRQNAKSVEYRISTEDKKTDISAKLSTRINSQEKTYAYEWSWKSQQMQNEGRMSLRLYDLQSGLPRAIDVEVVSPRLTSKLSCQTTWESNMPRNLYISFESNKEKLAEINMKIKDMCLVVQESIRSKEYMTNQICLWKRENTLKVISLKSSFQRRQCLVFEIEVDEQQPKWANIKLDWDRRNIKLAMHEASQFLTEVKDVYVSPEDVRALKQTLRSVYEKSYEQLSQALQRHSQSAKEYLLKAKHFSVSRMWEILSHYIPVNSEMLQSVIEVVGCICERYVRFLRENVPEMLRPIWEQGKTYAVECMKSHCSSESLCYELATLLENFELERAKMVLSRRISKAKRALSSQLEQVEIPDIMKSLAELARVVYAKLESFVGSFFNGDVVERMRKYWREEEEMIVEIATRRWEQLLAYVRRWLRSAEKDEDFRVLKSVLNETKDKAIHAWHHRASLMQPLCQIWLRDYPREWLQGRVQVQQYAPQEGTIRIQVQNPLQSQFLEKAFLTMKSKILSEKL